ncbi:MAG: glycosyltransferase, partial [Oscillospiraceae bacterium]|nr:glycosyltransferase [Oscillospiraceae bacterium]
GGGAGAPPRAEGPLWGTPAVRGPRPIVTNNHPHKHARVLEKAGGAVVLTEPGLSADTLKKTVLDLIHDRARLEEMERCMRACAVSDATERITDVVLDLAGKA